MITNEQWFTAKHSADPPFRASIRRQERHYGHECPVKIGWFRRNLGFIIASLSGIGMVFAFAAFLLLTFTTLLPNAIEAELDRQIAVVESQINGGVK